jgi:hypothetical protein
LSGQEDGADRHPELLDAAIGFDDCLRLIEARRLKIESFKGARSLS